MPLEPSPQLVELLARLGLATASQVHRMRRKVKQLARGAPLCDAVWVDALVQSRLLTPFQGAEIIAGRGESLVVGQYLLQRRRGNLGYAEDFIAVDRQSKNKVHLLLARPSAADDPVCMATPWQGGICAAWWLACHGRFTPSVALEIARQLAVELASLESSTGVHGDISATAVFITSDGSATITRAGIRNILRPDESLDSHLLPLEALDYLAPERIFHRVPASSAADVYSFGLLCWHLLTGRTPRPGGNHAAKLSAIASSKIPDVRRFAPETPAVLQRLIECCVQSNPSARPKSFRDIAELLGPPTAIGRRRLIDTLGACRRSTLQPNWKWRVQSTLNRSAAQFAAAAACLVLLATATWPLWRSRDSVGYPAPAVHQVASKPLAGNVDSEPVQAKQNVELASFVTVGPSRPVTELTAVAEVSGASLHLQPEMIVRGTASQRPRILVPPEGIVVAVDNVRFENVDFIWRHRAERIVAPERNCLIEQRSRRIEFVGCTFQAVEALPYGLPPAVRVKMHAPGVTALPVACRVQLDRCYFKNVSAAIWSDSQGPTAVEVEKTLHAGPGPLVQLSHFPTIDGAVKVSMKQVTVRAASHVIGVNLKNPVTVLGSLNISAQECALELAKPGALIAFAGNHLPQPADNGRMPIEWAGQSSLANPEAVVAVWQHHGETETLPEECIAVEGLVTGKIEFAGTFSEDPNTSRLTNWLAPLLSDEPPGIDASLPKMPPLNLIAIP